MKSRSRSILILTLLFGYVLLQFLWWEVLLVKQTGTIINEKQKLAGLNISDPAKLEAELADLNRKKTTQTIMIVSEGTIFLLLLLFGVHKIKKSQDRENEFNNRQKNFFLSITHELKTPIAATKLQLQTMQRQKLDEQTRQQLIANALNETERLNMLIDNVLLASRLESGELLFKPEKTNLARLITETAERYYKAQLASGELSLHLDDSLQVMADPFAFPSVITNLVDNALKYSPVTRQVTIEATREGREAVLRVADKGAGIPQKDRARIFDRFVRADNEATRQAKGTGLGLYIVNYIVSNHKASISVRDNRPAGSVFEIRLNAV